MSREIIEERYFKAQVGRGLRDEAEGRIITQAQMREEVKAWRKSAGR